jgi:hypothetical protein
MTTEIDILKKKLAFYEKGTGFWILAGKKMRLIDSLLRVALRSAREMNAELHVFSWLYAG